MESWFTFAYLTKSYSSSSSVSTCLDFSGASKNLSRIEFISQLNISLQRNGNLSFSQIDIGLLVSSVVSGFFRGHNSDHINESLHLIMIEAIFIINIHQSLIHISIHSTYN